MRFDGLHMTACQSSTKLGLVYSRTSLFKRENSYRKGVYVFELGALSRMLVIVNRQGKIMRRQIYKMIY